MPLTPLEIMKTGPVIPVIVIKDAAKAVPLANALLAGGVKTMEITLRSDAALEAIKLISSTIPDIIIGAGTVSSAQDLKDVVNAGALFAISPGITPALLKAAADCPIPLIPGIATASELMLGMEAGLTEFKFFPAEAAGGIPMLKSLAGPYPHIRFCPTGGISPTNYKKYLQLKNVICVGGSWLAPENAMTTGDWSKITNLCDDALA